MFSWTLSRIHDCREAYQIFNGMPNGAREVIVGFSSLLNIRILNEPARKIISDVSTVFSDVMYGKDARLDTFIFFYICVLQKNPIDATIVLNLRLASIDDIPSLQLQFLLSEVKH